MKDRKPLMTVSFRVDKEQYMRLKKRINVPEAIRRLFDHLDKDEVQLMPSKLKGRI